MDILNQKISDYSLRPDREMYLKTIQSLSLEWQSLYSRLLDYVARLRADSSLRQVRILIKTICILQQK